ncbi:MAG: hypothetical protein LBR47_07305 [Spirochaetaceae bacterium]|jgi:hypothetical protein|nr:hypothetical protein [Spirochaetaceae bacterium]
MSQKKDLLGTVIDLGNVLADVTKHKDGGYTTIFSGKSGYRPELGKCDVGSKSMLLEVLSWFAKM